MPSYVDAIRRYLMERGTSMSGSYTGPVIIGALRALLWSPADKKERLRKSTEGARRQVIALDWSPLIGLVILFVQ